MKIARHFTKLGTDPFATVEWARRSSRISNPDGSVVFEMNDVEMPAQWSQLAVDIMVSKYFRKAGVPREDGTSRPETSARQVIHRLAGCWRHWGEAHGYFDSKDDAQAFYDELAYMMLHQMCAPNSPQWFNTGLNWAYGINGPAQGHWYADAKTGEVRLSEDSYTHPQPHACFIQSVSDDLVNDGGIMDLWTREARLFKYGSGTGTNFSGLRGEGELLSGGGKSSGLMSWLKIGDRAAGAIKSGGTTRRAAKMVCLDMDHPDIENFVNWKVREELKVAALVEGLKALPGDQRELARELGLELSYDFNGEAYQTVSGQNANNSVRIGDDFFDAIDKDGDWVLRNRTDDEVAKTIKARGLWDQINRAAWRCADPGVQYDTTINAWHTCPQGGRINASNPCSEYMFLDDTACNLASLNLLTFWNAEDRTFDVERFEHGVDLWTMVLEISVLMAQYPSREIAQKSYDYRTLGLGYANIGAMLMQAGMAYDSDESRAVAGMITAIMTGRSYRMSALMAKELGAFAKFNDNREDMLRVMRNHRRAAHGVDRDAKQWESLRIRPVSIEHRIVRDGRVKIANADDMLERAAGAWDDALKLGEKHGYRNAQTTVIAPTGTIGLLMDCDTTGVEPDFALVKFKKLAGGGYFRIVNQSVVPALRALGYAEPHIKDIIEYVLGAQRLDVKLPPARPGESAPGITLAGWLRSKGLNGDDLASIEKTLPGMFEIGFAFSAWALGDDALERVDIEASAAKANPKFNLLEKLGLSKHQIDRLNEIICGTQTIEGAPHLRSEHFAVFDCANPCGKKGTRFIAAQGHIRMMAATQPFISGAISKTINLPNSATEEDIAAAYRLSWELGLKANALYRDGCKLSQPLNTKSDDAKEETHDVREPADVIADFDDDEDALEAARTEVADEVREVAVSISDGDTSRTVRMTEHIVHRPMRRRLPDTRQSITHKFNIAGHEGYLTVGLYEDGSPGELFITMAKEGSTIGGLMDSLGTATSVALQYGVPIDSLVRKFTHQRFEPAGMTTNRDIPIAKSLVDYIFRWMGMQFIEGYREANAPRREPPAEPAPNSAVEAKPTSTPSRGSAPTVGANRLATATTRHTSDSAPVMQARTDGTSALRLAQTDEAAEPVAIATSVLSVSLTEQQQDAPACDVCGTITVRSGTCYKCLNCGASMGCS